MIIISYRGCRCVLKKKTFFEEISPRNGVEMERAIDLEIAHHASCEAKVYFIVKEMLFVRQYNYKIFKLRKNDMFHSILTCYVLKAGLRNNLDSRPAVTVVIIIIRMISYHKGTIFHIIYNICVIFINYV